MSTFHSEGEIIEVSRPWIDRLKLAAEAAPLRRARLCLHKVPEDPIHEMLIAFCRDSYVKPHRHRSKSESFHLVEGELDVVFFDYAGNVIRRVEMSTKGTFLYRLESSLWHSVFLKTDHVVLHETTKGPFVQGETEVAPFAPAQDDTRGIERFWIERSPT